MSVPRFAVAIPAFDEAAANLAFVTRRTPAIHADVIVVDDGLWDGTGDLAHAFGVPALTRPVIRCNGRVLKIAFDHFFALGYDAVITLDADGQHPPEEISKLSATSPYRPVIVSLRIVGAVTRSRLESQA
jgi:glycosyltransferase involved in cell wall biosynthesis